MSIKNTIMGWCDDSGRGPTYVRTSRDIREGEGGEMLLHALFLRARRRLSPWGWESGELWAARLSSSVEMRGGGGEVSCQPDVDRRSVRLLLLLLMWRWHAVCKKRLYDNPRNYWCFCRYRKGQGNVYRVFVDFSASLLVVVVVIIIVNRYYCCYYQSGQW